MQLWDKLISLFILLLTGLETWLQLQCWTWWSPRYWQATLCWPVSAAKCLPRYTQSCLPQRPTRSFGSHHRLRQLPILHKLQLATWSLWIRCIALSACSRNHSSSIFQHLPFILESREPQWRSQSERWFVCLLWRTRLQFRSRRRSCERMTIVSWDSLLLLYP